MPDPSNHVDTFSPKKALVVGLLLVGLLIVISRAGTSIFSTSSVEEHTSNENKNAPSAWNTFLLAEKELVTASDAVEEQEQADPEEEEGANNKILSSSTTLAFSLAQAALEEVITTTTTEEGSEESEEIADIDSASTEERALDEETIEQSVSLGRAMVTLWATAWTASWPFIKSMATGLWELTIGLFSAKQG